jgi:integrase/recombinase XerD
VFGYLKALAASERAGNTIAMRAKCLAVILQVLVPDDDWQFLSRIVAISKTTGDPALKSGRIVDTLVLQDLGRRLVSEAESAVLDGQVSLTAALDHRDGLVIWLLAVRPMRRRNLTDLEIGSTICLERDRYWVHIPGSAVKTGRPLDFPVPDTLTQVVDRHLDVFRPRLLAERFPATGTRRLWIAATGTPLTDMGVFQAIAKRTKIGLGVSIPPHFFRDCAASSLYRASPENALAIAGVLGHSNLQTSKLHYVHGAQIAATVQLHSVIEELRATDRAPPKLFRKTQEHLFGPAVTDREDLV